MQDYISISVILVYIIPAGLYIYTKNLREIVAIVGAFGSSLISEGIKHLIIGTKSPRPKGANGCNLLCTNGLQEGRPGMPSGHSGLVAFFVGYYWNETNQLWIKVALVAFAALVMYSRYTKRCHSVEQIITGGLFGLGMSQLVTHVYKSYVQPRI